MSFGIKYFFIYGSFSGIYFFPPHSERAISLDKNISFQKGEGRDKNVVTGGLLEVQCNKESTKKNDVFKGKTNFFWIQMKMWML